MYVYRGDLGRDYIEMLMIAGTPTYSEEWYDTRYDTYGSEEDIVRSKDDLIKHKWKTCYSYQDLPMRNCNNR